MLREKVEELNKEVSIQKSRVQTLNKDNKLLKDLSRRKQQDIQLKYSEISQKLDEQQITLNNAKEEILHLNGML